MGLSAKKNKNKSLILSFDRQVFIRQLIASLDEGKEVKLYPIIIFDKDNVSSVHHLWIVRINHKITVDIGISLKIDGKSTVTVSGIHLDWTYIRHHHQLIDCYHVCHCFDGFKSNVTDLIITCHGDAWYKQQYEMLKKQNKE